MKIKADTHSHTIASGHAYSTIREMAKAGAEAGLELLAITEHAPMMPETCGKFYFSNFGIIPREAPVMNPGFQRSPARSNLPITSSSAQMEGRACISSGSR